MRGAFRRVCTKTPHIVLDSSPLLLSVFVPASVSDWARGNSTFGLYYAALAVWLCLWFFALQSYFAFSFVDENTRHLKSNESTDPPGFSQFSFWCRIMNPFWTTRKRISYKNIIYATKKELQSAGPGSERFLCLDVHRHSQLYQNCPVLMYIHGDHWHSSSKETLPPFLNYMLLKKWIIVCVNYRSFPFNYPSAIVDVKRCVRWIKENIIDYGGDPYFLSACGSNSGAHLASLLSLTPTLLEYQPGFEHIHCNVQACVSLNGLYDLTSDSKEFTLKSWIINKIIGCHPSQAQLETSSPKLLLDHIQKEKRKWCVESIGGIVIQDADDSTLIHYCDDDLTIPPFMIIHTSNDGFIPVKQARDFYFAIKAHDHQSIYIELPWAGNQFELKSGPRGHYIAYGIERFLAHSYLNYKTILKDQ